MADDPRQLLVEEAHKILAAMRRLGFHDIAQRRMEQAIQWMESDVTEIQRGNLQDYLMKPYDGGSDNHGS